MPSDDNLKRNYDSPTEAKQIAIVGCNKSPKLPELASPLVNMNPTTLCEVLEPLHSLSGEVVDGEEDGVYF